MSRCTNIRLLNEYYVLIVTFNYKIDTCPHNSYKVICILFCHILIDTKIFGEQCSTTNIFFV